MTTTVERHTVTTHHQTQARALAVAAAVGAALGAWTLMVPLLGVQLAVHTGPDATQVATVGPALVAATSLLASLLGWGLLPLPEARTPAARTIWTTTATVVLLVSMAGPLTGALTLAATIDLMVLHLSVAAVLIPLLRRTTTTRP